MKVRKEGWAIEDEEYLRNNRCIAAPVYNYTGSVIASIAMNGDCSELTDEKLPLLVAALKDTATLVSKGMGYMP